MSTIKRISTGILISFFALGGMTACSQEAQQTKEEEGVVGVAEYGAQETEEKAKDVEQSAKVTQERAEKEVEEFIGGGPVKSDTEQIITEVEREMKAYQDAIDEKGQKLDAATQLKMQNIEERISLVKKQYNELQQQTDWGVAEIDAEIETQAENIEDDWDDLEDNLEDMLGESYD
jgi:hypothetical protein